MSTTPSLLSEIAPLTDDIRPMVDRPNQKTFGEPRQGLVLHLQYRPTTDAKSIVDHQGNIHLVSDLSSGLVKRYKDQRYPEGTDLGNFSDVWNVVFRVSDGLEVDTFGLLVDCIPKFFWVIGFNPLHTNAEFLEEYCGQRSLAKKRKEKKKERAEDFGITTNL